MAAKAGSRSKGGFLITKESLPKVQRTLNLTKGFAIDWSPDKAAIELLANWLDAMERCGQPERKSEELVECKDAEGRMQGTIELEEGKFSFTNYGVTPPPGYAMLVMGNSIKSNRQSHGQFGEGLKAAIAIATRNGGRVVIEGLMDFGRRSAEDITILEPRKWTTFVDSDGIICVDDSPSDELFDARVLKIHLEMASLSPSAFRMDKLIAKEHERVTGANPYVILAVSDNGKTRPSGTIIVNNHVLPQRSRCLFAYSFADTEEERLVDRTRTVASAVNLPKYVAKAWDAALVLYPTRVVDLYEKMVSTWNLRVEHEAIEFMSDKTRAILRAHIVAAHPDSEICFDADSGLDDDCDIMPEIYVLPETLEALYAPESIPTKSELCAVLGRRTAEAPRVELPDGVQAALQALHVSVVAVRAGNALRKTQLPGGVWVVNLDAIDGYDVLDCAQIVSKLMHMKIIDVDSEEVSSDDRAAGRRNRRGCPGTTGSDRRGRRGQGGPDPVPESASGNDDGDERRPAKRRRIGDMRGRCDCERRLPRPRCPPMIQ